MRVHVGVLGQLRSHAVQIILANGVGILIWVVIIARLIRFYVDGILLHPKIQVHVVHTPANYSPRKNLRVKRRSSDKKDYKEHESMVVTILSFTICIGLQENRRDPLFLKSYY